MGRGCTSRCSSCRRPCSAYHWQDGHKGSSQDEIQQVCRPLWHYSRDAKSRRQQGYWFLARAYQICRETWQNPWGLGDEFYPKPLQGWGWCSQQRKLQRSETHRTCDESHGENCGWDDAGDNSHWWNAIRLCPWTRYNQCYIHHSAAPGEILYPGKISMTRTWLCSLLLLIWRKRLTVYPERSCGGLWERWGSKSG